MFMLFALLFLCFVVGQHHKLRYVSANVGNARLIRPSWEDKLYAPEVVRNISLFLEKFDVDVAILVEMFASAQMNTTFANGPVIPNSTE